MSHDTSNLFLERVHAYHNQTKHRFGKYAAGPDFLDWDQQPDPFRRFAPAELIPLPFDFEGLPDLALNELNHPPLHKAIPEWGLQEISSLLRFSLGLAAWKVAGPDRWSLRCNPSSGNLHPTEAYLIIRGLTALPDGVYHYAPYHHALELRAEMSVSAQTSENQIEIFVGLSSIAWREAWKYGERAYRYVQLDLGHAIGALAYSAATLGMHLTQVCVERSRLATLLGVDRKEDFADAESESPDLLLRLSSGAIEQMSDLPDGLVDAAQTAVWHGQANRLSTSPQHHWPIIQEMEQAMMESPPPEKGRLLEQNLPAPRPPQNQSTHQLILQRRSAQAFNGKSSLSQEIFFQILDQLLPRQNETPWNSWPFQPNVHLVLFVHNVDNLSQGLYLLPRHSQAIPQLKASMNQDFLWEHPDEAPDQLPLFRLVTANSKKVARALSCHQEIAASSFFSLGMLAEFDNTLSKQGHQAYPELFWEAGLIGQVLYLQAEAHSVRGTGIGCFFDDGVHETLGLSNTLFQSLYHFTVGQPKTDDRLQTLPPYQHIERS
ncbi:MAG: SagB/ThcOx family dehydrogenase [Candidatus Thiodiazotropha sp.]|jgi:SagB-type dehydrogenase family enzyme